MRRPARPDTIHAGLRVHHDQSWQWRRVAGGGTRCSTRLPTRVRAQPSLLQLLSPAELGGIESAFSRCQHAHARRRLLGAGPPRLHSSHELVAVHIGTECRPQSVAQLHDEVQHANQTPAVGGDVVGAPGDQRGVQREGVCLRVHVQVIGPAQRAARPARRRPRHLPLRSPVAPATRDPHSTGITDPPREHVLEAARRVGVRWAK